MSRVINCDVSETHVQVTFHHRRQVALDREEEWNKVKQQERQMVEDGYSSSQLVNCILSTWSQLVRESLLTADTNPPGNTDADDHPG